MAGFKFDTRTVSTEGMALAANYFFSPTAAQAPLNAYKEMTLAEAPGAEAAVASNAVTATGVPGTLLFQWITLANNPHVEKLAAAIYECHAHLKKTGTKSVAVYYEIWETDAAGADVELVPIMTSATIQGITTADTFYDIYATLAAEKILAGVTSRLAIRFYGYTTSAGTSTTISMTVAGTNDPHFGVNIESSELHNIVVPYTGAVANVDLGSKTLTTTGAAALTHFYSPEYTCAGTGVNLNAFAVNWNNGKEQYLLLDDGANTVTLTNPVAGAHYMLIVKQAAAGATSTITWTDDAIIKWHGGVDFVPTGANGAVDVIFLNYSAALGAYIASYASNLS